MLAADHFDSNWLSKVSPVRDNKRLKVNNIRKVVASTMDYLKDVVGMQLTQFPVPDVNKVGFIYLLLTYIRFSGFIANEDFFFDFSPF